MEGHEYYANPVNEKKAKRRQLYRSMSQDRIGATVKPYNFFNQVCENKEIAKFTAALANCTQIFRDSFQEFMKVYIILNFIGYLYLYKKVVFSCHCCCYYQDLGIF